MVTNPLETTDPTGGVRSTSTQYFLWSCLTDAVRRRASVVARTHCKVRSVVKNGPGDRYKQDPFQGTFPVGIRSLQSLVGRLGIALGTRLQRREQGDQAVEHRR